MKDLIGENIREKRNALGMTQEQFGRAVAELLNSTWSRQAVSAAENGKRDWRAEDLVAAAYVLGTSPAYLMQPKLADDLDLPGKTVSFEDLVAVTVSKDSDRVAAARDTLDLLGRLLDEVGRQVENARQKVGFASAMLTQAERRAKK